MYLLIKTTYNYSCFLNNFESLYKFNFSISILYTVVDTVKSITTKIPSSIFEKPGKCLLFYKTGENWVMN